MSAEARTRRGRSVAERFESFVDRSDECHVWKGATNAKGYGQFLLDGRCEQAHRVAVWLASQVWPAGMVLHSCDNPPCVNPRHLRVGDAAQNMADALERGRLVPSLGENNGRSKLTEAHARAILAENPRSKTHRQRVAETYGVSADSVKDLVYRRTWRHL